MQINGYAAGERYTGNTSVSNSSQSKNADYMELIANYKKEIFDKVKNNETEEEIQTGGASYTQSKWSKLMESVDQQIEDVREQQEERLEKQREKAEAKRIYEAVSAGKKPTLEILHKNSNVPYGEFAQDGVITYNGVTFVCDERTNSICLGDMSDKSKVLNIALSDGGCLKVNRDNIGDLSACVGMFSPEDLNLIMRAIAQDTKAQEMLLEKEDMEGVPLRDRPVDAE